jgi:hypothetical protein
MITRPPCSVATSGNFLTYLLCLTIFWGVVVHQPFLHPAQNGALMPEESNHKPCFQFPVLFVTIGL